MTGQTNEFIRACKEALPVAAFYFGVVIVTALACRALAVSSTGPIAVSGFMVTLGASIYFSSRGYERGKREALGEADPPKCN